MQMCVYVYLYTDAKAPEFQSDAFTPLSKFAYK